MLLMRVATWNLERADLAKPVGVTQTQQIGDVHADVWLLTEARAAAAPPGFKIAVSVRMLTQEPAYFAAIAARRVEGLPLPEVPTGVAALVEQHGDEWLVISVCMPWRLGAPDLPGEAAPGASTGPEQWRTVLNRLDTALARLRRRFTSHPLVLGGDFDQALSGWLTGGTHGRDQLQALLAHHGLVAHTADQRAAQHGAGTIDHLCSTRTASRTGRFTPAPVSGRKKVSSDHAGYWADIE